MKAFSQQERVTTGYHIAKNWWCARSVLTSLQIKVSAKSTSNKQNQPMKHICGRTCLRVQERENLINPEFLYPPYKAVDIFTKWEQILMPQHPALVFCTFV
jgi:hypothetical protein